ncbi:hypothetical protein VTI74DRAFT_3759 [Chaetomium olivicolor]
MGASDQPADSTSDDAVVSSTNPYSLHRAVRARRSEYVRRHRLRIKIGSWNVAACPGTDKDLARWFIDGEGLDPTLGSSKPPDNRVAEIERGENNSEDASESIQLARGDKIGLYVLGLQEVNVLTAPGQYMTWIYADTKAIDRWKAALEGALPDDYQLVVLEQLAGMLLLIYAAPEIASTISNTSSINVPTGALGYLGNKGAICTRIMLGETTQLLFVNCHLASGVEDYYSQRRMDQARQIMTQARFEPICIAGVSEEEQGRIGDEDFAFWFGDLNSRLDRLPGDDIRRLLMLHTRGEYDVSKTRELRRQSSLEGEPIVVHRMSDSSEESGSSDQSKKEPLGPTRGNAVDNSAVDDESVDLPDPDEFAPDPHEDPASLQATLDSLLPHDQLLRVMRDRRMFHEGWREGPITFLPTYKYDVGTVALFDSSEKRRPPSWCDRILYRTRKDIEEHRRKAKEEEEARKKDEEMKARGMEEEGDDDVLFSYDPDNDGENQPSSTCLDYDEYDEAGDGDGGEGPKQQDADRIQLEFYTSHQRITSSDHKPISAIFTLEYDAVVPELKAKVHAEVARELDRAENEGRPGITVVVDHHDSQLAEDSSGSESAPHVDFGELRFLKKEIRGLTLANTGRVGAKFSFVEKPTTDDAKGEGLTQTQWLTTSFVRSEPGGDEAESANLGDEVTLEPGETVNALLEALVDDISLAQQLNEGQTILEEVLVLRVTDGRDHFIPVRASWAPTCIGRSVDELIRVSNGGIRPFAKALSEKKRQLGAIPYDLPPHRPAPKELFQLTESIETLTQRVLADTQMLEDCALPSDPGWPFDEVSCQSTDSSTRTAHVTAILDALDQDQSISSAFVPETSSLERLEAVAQTLLLFLRGLTDGVIPTPLWNKIEQAAPSITSLTSPSSADSASDDDDRTTILDILQSAPNHNICFVFLTTTLARVIAELSPLSKAELELTRTESPSSTSAATTAVKGIGGVLGGMGRLGLGRRGTGATSTPVVEALAALEKRKAREKRAAEIFGPVVCRGKEPVGRRERAVMEERKKGVVGLFLRRSGE